MSCRSTRGGQAASAVAGLLSGMPVDDVPSALHGLRRETLNSFPESSAPADPERAAEAIERLAMRVRHQEGLDEARRERTLLKCEAAAQELRAGLNVPDMATLAAWESLPVVLSNFQLRAPAADSAQPVARPERSPGSHLPYHKRFKNFNAEVLAATDRLFTSRPSQLSQPEREAAFADWVRVASEAYGMEMPRMRWDTSADHTGGGYYTPGEHSITLTPNHPSITTLIHEFRHALQSTGKGAAKVSSDVEVDARAWSLSLYHKVRPNLFARLVREGRIFHISPDDLD